MEKQFSKHKLSFPVTFEEIGEIKNGDTRFTKLKCWLMHTHENYNNSYFSREVIERAIPTLAYIPVVGFIEDNNLGEKDFSDHRYVITKDNGKIKQKYVGSAYGVILNSEDNNAHFEKKICDDGVEREFIVADAIAWNFLEDSSQILNRDLVKDHSIELDEDSIEGYEDEETGMFYFQKFSFRAACILGGTAQPAMEGSTVEVVNFTMNDFVTNLQNELINKYNIFTELVNKKQEQGGMEMPNTDFSQTLMEQFADISAMVSNYDTVANRWGETCPRYESVDIQDGEVIVVDRKDNYRHYGFPFTVNGDKPVIDFNSGVRKKIQYVNYEEGAVSTPNGAFDFGSYIEQLEKAAYEKIMEANKNLAEMETAKETAETNYSSIKNDYDEIKPKYDEYVKAEVEREQAEIETQKNEMFSQFEKSLGEHPDFVSLKENKADFSVDEIEAKCSILFTRLNRSNFAKTTNKEMTVGIPDNSFSPDDTSVVSARYGNISINK